MARAAADPEPERPDPSGGPLPGIRVTRAVNNELRALRSTDPDAARSVDNVISHLNFGATGEPVAIDIPGAPPDREYRAIAPVRRGAPVVIYRPIRPEDHVAGEWLVTALVDPDTFRQYRQAERRGIADDPAVKHITGQVAGTVAGTASTITGANVGEGGPQPPGSTD